MHRASRGRWVALVLVGLALVMVVSCTSDRTPSVVGDGPDASVAADPAQRAIVSGGQALSGVLSGGAADTSRSVVQHVTRVERAPAAVSRPFRELPDSAGEEEEVDHEPLRPPARGGALPSPEAMRDRNEQKTLPIANMPATTHNFHGQGANVQACLAGCATPPDTNGAVGPSNYVQTTNVNGNQGLAIWDKAGNLLSGPKKLNTLWSGLAANDPCRTRNDGDPVVVYDQLADRWFITQFALPNMSTDAGPSYQCVAVSQTSDPTGTYNLYEFSYPYAIDDYGKFSIWGDAYYANFHMFGVSSFFGDDFCAYDRSAMLAGSTATQHCFFQAYPTGTPPACPAAQPFYTFGALPASLDGPIPPPAGEPEFYVQFDQSQCGNVYNKLDLWAMHVDWTNPANSTLTGPSAITVNSFSPTCSANFLSGGSQQPQCVPQPGTNVTLDGLDDRLMFRLAYRNFGQYESLVVNHSVVGGNGTGGTTHTGSAIRWYEIQMQPGGASPTIAQQSTYAPNDKNWRWMGSIAQDMAGDMALGFAVSSDGSSGAVSFPSIGWTGRVNTDTPSTMGQAETIFDNGTNVEADAYGGQLRGRWGDYSNMTIDPTDDCTFWYTQELYDTSGSNVGNWDTWIASSKFPNCGQNDFTIALAPATRNVSPGGSTTYTVTVTKTTSGAGEPVTLYIQNLPTGVTLGSFNPATIAAGGGTSTLTLNAAASAPATGSPAPTFMVIGKAKSAVHAATAQIAVVGCGATGASCCSPGNTCQSGNVCQSGTCVACGGAGQACCAGNVCTAPDTCGGGGTAGVCGCTSNNTCSNGHNCGTGTDNCNNTITCGTCAAPQTCGGGGTTGMCGCTSNNTCTGGAKCGTGTDNCGNTISCGTCTLPQTCGGGGTAGQCGCTPTPGCVGGQNCGSGHDNCGNAVASCGTCSAPQTCGGGGTTGVCGCTSNNTCSNGHNCGTGTDNCGNTITCGTCAAPQTCGGGGTPGMCGGSACVSNGKCTSGAVCGTGTDNCGNTISCGTCTAPQTCGGGGTAGQCGCTSNGKCASGATCGTGADNCGTTISCGTCTAPQTCGGGGVAGQCGGGTVNDAGTGDGGSGNDGGSTTDAGGSDGGSTTDAGAKDGGSTTDAGTKDGGSTNDAGTHDGGSTTDAGGSDAGGSDASAGNDAGGTHNDGGAGFDAGLPGDASIDGGAGSGGGGGCGCVTAGSDDSGSSRLALAGFGGLGLIGLIRVRRRRTRR